jgi:hypothetical protein
VLPTLEIDSFRTATLKSKSLEIAKAIVHDFAHFTLVSDDISQADFHVFEIEEVMNLAPKFGLPALLYLFRRIERSLKGQPAAILADEAWLMLGHPVLESVKNWVLKPPA